MKTATICGIIGCIIQLILAAITSFRYGGLYNFDEYIAPIVFLIFMFSFFKRLSTTES